MQDWQRTLLQRTEDVAARTAKSGPRRPWIGFLLRLPPEAHAALREIARDRDVAMTTYLRRLLIMAIAKERGEPLGVWLDRLPAAMPYGTDHIRNLEGRLTYDSGSGMEGMCTHPGCGQTHL